MFKKNIIRSWCAKEGFKRAKDVGDISPSGAYTHHLQIVYHRRQQSALGLIEERLYFAADMDRERVVFGYLKKNSDVRDGVLLNRNVSCLFAKYTQEHVEDLLNTLID
jgi:hypothetical protein